MADRGTIEELKQEIDEYIYTNGRQEITGEILNDVLNDIVDTLAEHSGGGNVAWGTVSGATQNLKVDDDVRPLLRPQTGVSGFLNADGTVDTTHYLSEEDAEDTYQPIIDASHKLAYSLISGTPTALPNPFALTFGSKTYDGSAAKEITASDLGALTSHQTIYSLVLKVNGTQVGSYTPNSAAETINITDVASANDVLTLQGYFTNGKANDADKLDGNDSSYYASANSVTTIAGYFTDGSAKTAVKLLTSRSLWGQSFDGSANVSGDMSSVGKITFTAKTSASSSGNVLEVVTINGTTYLHSVLPFYSDHAITAGGIGSGGGGGGGGLITTLYRTADFGKTIASGNDTFDGNAINSLYFRIVALENRPQGGVTSFNSRTGAITLSSSDVTTALGYTPVNKAGDTMTGTGTVLTIASTHTNTSPTVRIKSARSILSYATFATSEGDRLDYGWMAGSDWGIPSTGGGYMWATQTSGGGGGIFFDHSGLYYCTTTANFDQYTVYHSGNLTASVIAGLGTLSNSITGNAATATNTSQLNGHADSYFATAASLGNYLPLVGGNITGEVTFKDGTQNTLHIGKASYTWSGSTNSYPLIYSAPSNSDRYTMICMPHIPYLKNGERGYNGTTFGAIMRLESDTTNPTYWDIGIKTADRFSVSRAGTELLGLTNTGVLSVNGVALGARAFDNTAYLPLSGGTVSGFLVANYNSTYPLEIKGSNSVSVIKISSQTTSNVAEIGWLNGSGWSGNFAYILNKSSQGGLSVNNNGPYYFKTSLGNFAEYIIYHYGNANNSSSPWTASALTLNNGDAQFNIKDTGGVSRAFLGINAQNTQWMGYFGAVAGYKTEIYGNTISIRINTSPSEALFIASNGELQVKKQLSLGGSGYSLNSVWDCGIVAGANNHDKVVASYLRSDTNGATIGAHNSVLNDWANLHIGAKSYIYFDFSESRKAYIDNGGNIIATGALTGGQASDSRFKSNVKAYTNAMFKIMSLRPVEFDWNDLARSLNSENEGHSFGLIAQEVQGVIPEVVTPIYEKYLRVDYGKLSTLCIAGIQDHEREIRQLKYKVAELENRIHQLTS